jgi:formyl-CoA transferase
MSLLDVGMAILANQAAGFLNTGASPMRQGNTHPSLVPYQDLPTADGAMLLAVGNDGQFARFSEAAGQPQWARDARFATNTDRVRHRNALVPLIEAETRKYTTAEWIALLEHRAVPCGPINTVAQAFDDEQVKARQLLVQQPLSPAAAAQTGVASIASVASPLRLMDTPPVLRRAPPALGEHTDEVLRELRLDDTALAHLHSTGVIG